MQCVPCGAVAASAHVLELEPLLGRGRGGRPGVLSRADSRRARSTPVARVPAVRPSAGKWGFRAETRNGTSMVHFKVTQTQLCGFGQMI